MKKFLKRYVSALLCAVLIFTQIDPISVIYAKNVTKIVTGEDESDSENGLQKASPSETGSTSSRDDEEKDKNDGDDLKTDDDFESDILDEDILDEDILDEDILNNIKQEAIKIPASKIQLLFSKPIISSRVFDFCFILQSPPFQPFFN